MEIKAIVYTSNTGFTERYAKMLGEKTGLSVYSLKEAKRSLPENSSIIYLGWLMAGSIKGYKKASAAYDIKVLCGVGLGPTGSQLDDVRKSCGLAPDFPCFTLQGGMNREKLRGINKLMIKMLVRSLEGKTDKTPEEQGMLDLINKGGDYVSEDNLKEVIEYLGI